MRECDGMVTGEGPNAPSLQKTFRSSSTSMLRPVRCCWLVYYILAIVHHKPLLHIAGELVGSLGHFGPEFAIIVSDQDTSRTEQ